MLQFKKLSIIDDGNCLFKCFSKFIFYNENNHYEIINLIVNNMFNNWEDYSSFIIRYDETIIYKNKNIYRSNMLKNCIYGGPLEIKSFFYL